MWMDTIGAVTRLQQEVSTSPSLSGGGALALSRAPELQLVEPQSCSSLSPREPHVSGTWH